MGYRQNIDLCLASHIGAAGLGALEMLPQFSAAEKSVQRLREAYQSKSLAILRLPEREDDFSALESGAQRLRRADDVVFFGTGGSSLGGQALAQLAGWHVAGVDAFLKGPRLHFFDNLDEASFSSLLQNLNMERAQFVIVSKSGGTAETLVQTLLLFAQLEKEKRKIADHCIGLTEPANWKSNTLRSLLEKESALILEHDTGIGGRYSALTNVGLLPAALSGLDIRKLRKGAKTAVDELLQQGIADIRPAVGAMLMTAFAGRGLTGNVLMAYNDRLERFTAWFAQLWAESLGKQGKGTTPLRALGPVDQHSQLQLFLDGPADKVYTILTAGRDALGPVIDPQWAKRAGMEDFAGKGIFDLTLAQSQATAETLAKRGRPVRQLHADRLDEEAYGALMMHFFLETIIAADILQVDAFDQPAVEEGKVLAKAYLAKG